MQQPRVAARIWLRDTDACIASWQQTLFSVYRGPASVSHVALTSQHCRTLIERHPGSATYLSVIERSSPAPTEEVRRVLAVWSRDVIAQMAAAVIVAEGGGFKNAIVRGVGVALTALAPHKVPFKFSGSVAEGTQLLSRYIPEAQGGAAGLLLAVEEVRASWV
ncbi:MAG: hypothetical protein ABW061_21810 [Polyangiaceae bacterium]